MSNLRLFILIDDSLSMAAKFGPGQAETILIGAKRMVKHFLSQTEKNPRLEILIQAQSQFIDTDHINQLKFTRDWEKHRKDSWFTFHKYIANTLSAPCKTTVRPDGYRPWNSSSDPSKGFG